MDTLIHYNYWYRLQDSDDRVGRQTHQTSDRISHSFACTGRVTDLLMVFSGIPQGKNDSEQLQLLITVVPWVFYWYMM